MGSLLDNGKSLLLRKVPTAEANMNGKLACRDKPFLRINIPVAEVTAHQVEGDCAPFARPKFLLVKPT